MKRWYLLELTLVGVLLPVSAHGLPVDDAGAVFDGAFDLGALVGGGGPGEPLARLGKREPGNKEE